MKSKITRILIIILAIISLSGCKKYYTFNNTVNEANKDINALYNKIIEKIYKDNIPLDFTGGYSKYAGYQLYDKDRDGINELYIYRIHNFDKSLNNISESMISKPFIYEAYKIENNEPILFLSGEPRGSATCDNCYFSLIDDTIAYLNNSHSEENIIVYDAQNNIISELHCDYAFVAGNAEYDVYKINNIEVHENKYRKYIENINSKIGYFSVNLNE